MKRLYVVHDKASDFRAAFEKKEDALLIANFLETLLIDKLRNTNNIVSEAVGLFDNASDFMLFFLEGFEDANRRN